MVHALITGATGLLGKPLCHALLQEDIEKITLLVRNEEAAKQLGEDRRIQILKGDLCQPFSNEQKRLLQAHDEVYHLASCTLLSSEESRKRMIFQMNIEGTRNLLDIFSESNIQKFVYISSAYACGEAGSKVPEDWMPMPRFFRNPYEESKFLAESLIREYHEKKDLPFTVIRPSIVFDPREQSSEKKHTLYAYGKCIAQSGLIALKESYQKPIRLKGKENPALNIILLSTFVEEMLKLRQAPVNHVYNLVSEEPVAVQPLVDAVAEAIGFAPGYVFDSSLGDQQLSQPEQFAYAATRPFWPYLLGESPRWEKRREKEGRSGKIIQDKVLITEALKKFFSTAHG